MQKQLRKRKKTSKLITIALFVCAFIMLSTAKLFAEENQSEDFKPSGKVEGRIFTNFNASLTSDDKTKTFELKRAYFGYKYNFAPGFTAKLKIDVGGEDFIKTGIDNQYVFFKTAAVYYEQDDWNLAFGLQDTYQFKVQEKLWGKRYVLPAMLDIQKFNFSADIGFSAAYKLEHFDIDFGVFNGEGYKQFQTDDAFRGSVGATAYLMDKKVIARAYTDRSTTSTLLYSYSGFLGLDLDEFTLGTEYTFQNNYGYTEGHDRTGFSVFSQYNFSPKFGLWFRLDQLASSYDEINPGDEGYDEYLDHKNKVDKIDGSYIFTGLEYVIVPKHMVSSLNYQHHSPKGEGNNNSSFIYLNLEIKF
jgi:hypothetical protein